MSRNKTVKPNVISFTTTIEIPISEPIVLFANKDIQFWKNRFLSMQANSKSIIQKSIYDTCYATLKWADQCFASLEKIYNDVDSYGNCNLKFIFSFTDIEALVEFVQFIKGKVIYSFFN